MRCPMGSAIFGARRPGFCGTCMNAFTRPHVPTCIYRTGALCDPVCGLWGLSCGDPAGVDGPGVMAVVAGCLAVHRGAPHPARWVRRVRTIRGRAAPLDLYTGA